MRNFILTTILFLNMLFYLKVYANSDEYQIYKQSNKRVLFFARDVKQLSLDDLKILKTDLKILKNDLKRLKTDRSFDFLIIDQFLETYIFSFITDLKSLCYLMRTNQRFEKIVRQRYQATISVNHKYYSGNITINSDLFDFELNKSKNNIYYKTILAIKYIADHCSILRRFNATTLPIQNCSYLYPLTHSSLTSLAWNENYGDISILDDFKKLEELYLEIDVPDVKIDFSPLQHHKNLRYLHVGDMFTDKISRSFDLSFLRILSANLVKLSLQGCIFTVNLTEIDFPLLEKLDVRGSSASIGESGSINFKHTKMPNLRKLITGWEEFDTENKEIFQHLISLKENSAFKVLILEGSFNEEIKLYLKEIFREKFLSIH